MKTEYPYPDHNRDVCAECGHVREDHDEAIQPHEEPHDFDCWTEDDERERQADWARAERGR